VKSRELTNLGFKETEVLYAARAAAGKASIAGMRKEAVRSRLKQLRRNPGDFLDDPIFGKLAAMLVPKNYVKPAFDERETTAPWRQWGQDLDPASIQQLHNACRLPVSVAAALMPDAHVGYGLPIGGVLATDNAVIPYAVGVDIACRMKLTVLDLPVTALKGQIDRLVNAIESETRFGMGAKFEKPHAHEVMDADWKVSSITAQQKDKAWQQLGTSGSGNHFVEFGTLTLAQDDLGLKAGTYVALLSHSGSRGAGAQVAGHYSKLAMELHPELPREMRQLAWLDLDTQAGQEYWNAMNLMGQYAAANHAIIHRQIAKHLGADVLLDVENHHNFAWKERHVIGNPFPPEEGRVRASAESLASPTSRAPSPPTPLPGGEGSLNAGELIVHRKGATPAGPGVLGIIPGSMASPGFLVRGKGNAESLESASHGAGRAMSRTQARSTQSWSEAKQLLKEREVHLISAGLDEVPAVYKDIETVMAAQTDLVEVIARFDPRIVKMAPEGERAED
jgi:tRNA-splicing ligase RtcB